MKKRIGTPRPSVAEANRRRKVSLSDKFWTNINKQGPFHDTLGNCWQWTGTHNKGYGVMKDGSKEIKAHRFSYQINIGEIPKGLLVCHHCDNTLCVNPSHLFLGTDKDNSNDKVKKGRQSRLIGVVNPKSKLNEDQVKEIRDTYKKWSSIYGSYALAHKYGVSAASIISIVNKKSWSHVQ